MNGTFLRVRSLLSRSLLILISEGLFLFFAHVPIDVTRGLFGTVFTEILSKVLGLGGCARVLGLVHTLHSAGFQ